MNLVMMNIHTHSNKIHVMNFTKPETKRNETKQSTNLKHDRKLSEIEALSNDRSIVVLKANLRHQRPGIRALELPAFVRVQELAKRGLGRGQSRGRGRPVLHWREQLGVLEGDLEGAVGEGVVNLDGLDAVEEDRETRVRHVIERLDLVAEQLPQRLEVLRSRHRPRLHVPFRLLCSEILGNKGRLLVFLLLL